MALAGSQASRGWPLYQPKRSLDPGLAAGQQSTGARDHGASRGDNRRPVSQLSQSLQPVFLPRRQRVEGSVLQAAISRWAAPISDRNAGMSTATTSTNTEDTASIRYPSLAALQATHNELLKHQREAIDTPELLTAVVAFLHD